MKIFITGKNGQVGFDLLRALSPLGDVYSFSSLECNLGNEEQLRKLIKEIRPNIIVNAAAYTDVDKAEEQSDLAYAINSRGVRIIAQEAEKLNSIVIHYSTDYVFDGSKSGPYTEDDEPNPQNVYGASKYAGELELLNNCSRSIILRTTWVASAHGNNFLKTILKLSFEKDELKVISDQKGAPTSSSLIADFTAHIIHIITRPNDEKNSYYGLFHLASSGFTSWYSYAAFVVSKARELGIKTKINVDCIYPIKSKEYITPAVRPMNSCLNTEKIRSTFNLKIPEWESEVKNILLQIKKTKYD